MKELSEIIEKLHLINEDIVEKDNMINEMSAIVSLVSQLITDADFIRSDIYLDLRAKYFQQIEEKLKNLERKQVSIEPEDITTLKPKKDEHGKKIKQFTREEIQGPLRTDIFAAPKCRRVYARKKQVPKEKGEKSDGESAKKDKYISFSEGNDVYYIHIVDNVDQYDIYDQQMSLVGHLKEDTVTLICDSETLETKNIVLKTVPTTDEEHLFGPYILNSV
jgi:hypothetical protein